MGSSFDEHTANLIHTALTDATRLAIENAPAMRLAPLDIADELNTTDALRDYDVIREIHRGAQGVVFEAVHRGSRQKVAIKVLRTGPIARRSDARRMAGASKFFSDCA